jgi:hypothetical protein
MENQSFASKSKTVMKKFLRWTVILGLLIFVSIYSFYYFAVYEEGVMAGLVLSVTERGMFFKTHEGKMSVESFGSLKGVSPIAETRDFSIEGHQEEVIKALEEVSASGERVNLRFIRRYRTFPWRGETKYFVVRVERVADSK